MLPNDTYRVVGPRGDTVASVNTKWAANEVIDLTDTVAIWSGHGPLHLSDLMAVKGGNYDVLEDIAQRAQQKAKDDPSGTLETFKSMASQEYKKLTAHALPKKTANARFESGSVGGVKAARLQSAAA